MGKTDYMRPRPAWMKGKGQGAAAALALLALVAPRLITAAPLDLLEPAGSPADPSEAATDNFPGSAFFFAEGAFDPAPGAQAVQSRHVLELDSAQAAPAMTFRGRTSLDHYRALNCLTSRRGAGGAEPGAQPAMARQHMRRCL